jgi:hypothetical protein
MKIGYDDKMTQDETTDSSTNLSAGASETVDVGLSAAHQLVNNLVDFEKLSAAFAGFVSLAAAGDNAADFSGTLPDGSETLTDLRAISEDAAVYQALTESGFFEVFTPEFIAQFNDALGAVEQGSPNAADELNALVFSAMSALDTAAISELLEKFPNSPLARQMARYAKAIDNAIGRDEMEDALYNLSGISQSFSVQVRQLGNTMITFEKQQDVRELRANKGEDTVVEGMVARGEYMAQMRRNLNSEEFAALRNDIIALAGGEGSSQQSIEAAFNGLIANFPELEALDENTQSIMLAAIVYGIDSPELAQAIEASNPIALTEVERENLQAQEAELMEQQAELDAQTPTRGGRSASIG